MGWSQWRRAPEALLWLEFGFWHPRQTVCSHVEFQPQTVKWPQGLTGCHLWATSTAFLWTKFLYPLKSKVKIYEDCIGLICKVASTAFLGSKCSINTRYCYFCNGICFISILEPIHTKALWCNTALSEALGNLTAANESSLKLLEWSQILDPALQMWKSSHTVYRQHWLKAILSQQTRWLTHVTYTCDPTLPRQRRAEAASWSSACLM